MSNNEAPKMLGAVDLSRLGRRLPEPMPAERIVTRTFSMPAGSIPTTPGVASGVTNTGHRFAVDIAEGRELHLHVDGADHRVIGLPHLVEDWLAAMGCAHQPTTDPLLEQLTRAVRAANDVRIAESLGTVEGQQLAASQVVTCIEAIEASLRHGRDERARLESLTPVGADL